MTEIKKKKLFCKDIIRGISCEFSMEIPYEKNNASMFASNFRALYGVHLIEHKENSAAKSEFDGDVVNFSKLSDETLVSFGDKYGVDA
jgi:hypothetical protein